MAEVPKITLPSSLNKPYNIKSLNDNHTFLLDTGENTEFTLEDAITLWDKYFTQNSSIDNLKDEYGLLKSTVSRIIARFDEGDFDDYLDFSYLDYSYSIIESEQLIENHYSFKSQSMVNKLAVPVYSYNEKPLKSPNVLLSKKEDNYRILNKKRPPIKCNKYSNKPYRVISLNKNRTLKSADHNFPTKFTLEEAIFINNTYYAGVLDFEELSNITKITVGTLKRIINRFELGDFDHLLKLVNERLLKKLFRKNTEDSNDIIPYVFQALYPDGDINIKMNAFIEALTYKDTLNTAIEIAKLNLTDIETWCCLSKTDKNYNPFYHAFCLIENDDPDFIEFRSTIAEMIARPKDELSKRCSICGKILPVSEFALSTKTEDGLENRCKSCKRHKQACDYLSSILEYVTFEEVFDFNEIAKFYPDSMILQAQIYTLQESDLIIQTDENHYHLIGKEDIIEFLEEFSTGDIPSILYNQPIEKFLSEIKMGKRIEEACVQANLNPIEVDSWIEKGKNSENAYLKFYEKYMESIRLFENHKKDFIDKTEQRENLLSLIRYGYDVETALEKSKLDKNLFRLWERDLYDAEPFKSFIEEYNSALKSAKSDMEDFMRHEVEKMKILEHVLKGYSGEESCKLVDLDINILECWLEKDFEPYKSFNELFFIAENEIKQFDESSKKRSKLFALLKEGHDLKDSLEIANIKLDSFYIWLDYDESIERYADFKNKYHYAVLVSNLKKKEFEDNLEKRSVFLDFIRIGKTKKDSIQLAELKPSDVNSWITKGNKHIHPYDDFANEYNGIKKEIDTAKQFYKDKKPQALEFTQSVSEGYPILIACNKSSLDINDIDYWFKLGENNVNPFKKFYGLFQKANEQAYSIKEDYESKEKNRNCFLNEISNGRSIRESCKIAEITEKDFNTWMRLGKDNIKPYSQFKNEYDNVLKQIEKDKLHFYSKSKKIAKFIKLVKDGYDNDKALQKSNLNKNDFDFWIEKAEYGMKPYINFKRNYDKSSKHAKKELKEFKSLKTKRKDLISKIRFGYQRDKAAKMADLSLNNIDSWLSKGKNKIAPYSDFKKDYDEALEYATNELKEFNSLKSKQKLFISKIEYGYDLYNAAYLSELKSEKIETWLDKYELEDYSTFYADYNKAVSKSENERKEFISLKDKREDFISNVKEGFDKAISCEKADLEESNIDTWLNKGNDELEPYVDFSKEYDKSITYSESIIQDFNSRMENENSFLSFIEFGRSFKNSCKLADLSEKDVNLWLKRGNNNIMPFHEFAEKYDKSLIQCELNAEDFENSIDKRDKFISSIKYGYSFDKSCKLTDLKSETVTLWIEKSEENIDPYKGWNLKYEDSENQAEIEKKEFLNNNLNGFISSIEYGKNMKLSLEEAGIDSDNLKLWIDKGRNDIEPYDKFVNSLDKAEFLCDKNKQDFLSKSNNIMSFISNIKNGQNTDDALSNADISKPLFDKWIEKAENNINPYVSLLSDYEKAKKYFILKKEEFSNKEKNIQDFISNIKYGFSIEESCELSHMDVAEVNYWLNLGKNEIDYCSRFYKDYENALETFKNEKSIFEKKFKEIEIFLLNIKNGRTLEDSSRLSDLNDNELNIWINKGDQNIVPYDEFSRKFHENLAFANNLKDQFNKNSAKIEHFISNIRKGHKKIIAAEKSNLDVSLINQWIFRGENDISPFNGLSKSYEESKIFAKNKKQLFENSSNELGTFLSNIKSNKSEKVACIDAGLDLENLDYWIDSGKDRVKCYIRFYLEYEKALRYANYDEKDFLNQKNKIDAFISYIKEGYDKKNSINKADINPDEFDIWLEKGEKGMNPYSKLVEKIDIAKSFFNAKKEEFESSSQKRVGFMENIKMGRSLEDSLKMADIEFIYFNEWILKGHEEIEPFDEFSKTYDEVRDFAQKKLNEFNDFSYNRSRFMSLIRIGETKKDAAEESDLKMHVVDSWIEKGEKGIMPYEDFNKEYLSLVKISNDDKSLYKEKYLLRNQFISYIKDGDSLEKACNLSNLDFELVESWIDKGMKRIEPYCDFYDEYDNADRYANSVVGKIRNRFISRFLK